MERNSLNLQNSTAKILKKNTELLKTLKQNLVNRERKSQNKKLSSLYSKYQIN